MQKLVFRLQPKMANEAIESTAMMDVFMFTSAGILSSSQLDTLNVVHFHGSFMAEMSPTWPLALLWSDTDSAVHYTEFILGS